MNEFSALRAKAKQNRDHAINVAYQEYESALVRIAKLEKDLLGKKLPRLKKIPACVESVIPSDAEFTAKDIVCSLEAMDPSRVWLKRDVNRHLLRLRKRGIIRRVVRSRAGDGAVYVRGDVTIKVRPFEDMSFLDVIATVLGNRTLTAIELTVEMLESGYETRMDRKALRDAVGIAMRKEPGQFKRDGDRWALTIKGPNG